MSSSVARANSTSRDYQFYQLTKPRVVSLIVFTAVIGMCLATPGMVPLQALVAGTAGIALIAGAAAAVNCLGEQKIGAVFLRYAAKIYTRYSDSLARRTFRYSIFYLTALFAALLVDHYFRF